MRSLLTLGPLSVYFVRFGFLVTTCVHCEPLQFEAAAQFFEKDKSVGHSCSHLQHRVPLLELLLAAVRRL